jgi:hypothetical protein
VTDRIRLDDLTSNDLDQLYDRLAKAEQEAEDSIAAATRLTVLVGKRSEKAEKAAKNHRSRADTAETELRVLREGLRANGADPTQIQNLWAQIRLRNRQWRTEKQRIDRVRAAVDKLCHEPHPSHDHVCPDDVRKAILDALTEPARETT